MKCLHAITKHLRCFGDVGRIPVTRLKFIPIYMTTIQNPLSLQFSLYFLSQVNGPPHKLVVVNGFGVASCPNTLPFVTEFASPILTSMSSIVLKPSHTRRWRYETRT